MHTENFKSILSGLCLLMSIKVFLFWMSRVGSGSVVGDIYNLGHNVVVRAPLQFLLPCFR